MNLPSTLPPHTARAALLQAFQYWSNVAPLTFQEVEAGWADIRLSFHGRQSPYCSNSFDGPGRHQLLAPTSQMFEIISVPLSQWLWNLNVQAAPYAQLHPTLSNHLLTFFWGAAGHLPGVLSSLLFEAYALVLGLSSPAQDTPQRTGPERREWLGSTETEGWAKQRELGDEKGR